MSGVSSPCDAAPAAVLPGYIRADGRISARFAAGAGGTRLLELHESGGWRLKFPRGAPCEAGLINTAGGMTGGDRLQVSLTAEAGAEVTLASAAAEKVYRSDGAPTRVQVRLAVAAGAALHWLPHETILFRGARLERRLEADLADDARLTVAETMVCGRQAMGEVMSEGNLSDHWRIRRAGRLVFAEALKLEGDLAATLARPAVAGGAHAFATLLHVGAGAASLVEPLRALLDQASAGGTLSGGVSAWDGLVTLRLVGHEAARVKHTLQQAVALLPGLSPPRLWRA